MDAGGPFTWLSPFVRPARARDTLRKYVSVERYFPATSARQEGPGKTTGFPHLPGVERLLERLFVRERRVGLFQLGELDVHVLCASFAIARRFSTAHQAVALDKTGEEKRATATHGIVGRGFPLFGPVTAEKKEIYAGISSSGSLGGRRFGSIVSHHSRRLSFDGLCDCPRMRRED